jgi:hypothetical protein
LNGSESSEQPVDRFYRSFFEAEPPPGSSVSKAWRGTIQPFASDEIAKKLLRHLDRDLPVDVDHGELRPIKGAESVIEHWLEPMLVQMTTRFSILVLDYGNDQHPRGFSLRPRISTSVFPGHPHLRLDQSIVQCGYELQALCVYSAAEFRYSTVAPRIVQYLDQIAIYLAKHLIWMRTRRLYEVATGTLLYAPIEGQIVIDTEPRSAKHIFGISREWKEATKVWRGYWPGTIAPSGAPAHVKTISRTAQCWCGSGRSYGLCHRPFEVSQARLMSH